MKLAFRLAAACSAAALAAILGVCASSTPRDQEATARALVNQVTISISTFASSDDYPAIHDTLNGAYAVLVFPNLESTSSSPARAWQRRAPGARRNHRRWGGPAFYSPCATAA